MKTISILIADDHKIVRQGFCKLLSMERDFEVVGEASNGRAAIELALKLTPDIILMDIAMPDLNGLEATSLLLESAPDAKILILSAHCEDAYITKAVQNGVKGFLRKQSSASEVCKAIRAVHLGKFHFSPSVARHLDRVKPAMPFPQKSPLGAIAQLSSRERQVLQLIAEGRANKETASDLGIRIKTVEKHRASIMRKLDIHETAGLTRYAITNGLIENPLQPTTI
ncbi:MAG: response regulator transcription factor [Opitutales bacterium]|nr:response regulator transcription factor [Opitutales bacterium]